jgi:arylsulfatase A-like enzyme
MSRILTALLLSLIALSTTAPAAEKRPNILFILVDDQSPFDLKIYNPESTLETPNLDRLAREGMVFDGAYHMGSFSGAVCTPSRHMIMSGRTVWHLPIAPWGAKTCPPALEQQTIPAVFNRAGFATMRTCKQGNSYEAANQLFTVRHDATKRGGDHESGSAWHGDRVMDYLAQRESAKDANPFLIYYGFSHPHDTRDGTPELLAKYGATNHADPNTLPSLHSKQPKLPPNHLVKHPFRHGHDDVRDEVEVSGVWTNRDEATIRNETGRQYACSENIDIQIGRVLKRLEEMGELDNTYIFYTADHGMAIGRHGLQGKQNLYEHTWRVPFIVKGPGIKAGARVQGNIYLLDVLATLCDLTGTAPPATNEGLSFRPVLEGKQDTMREVMYGAYSGGGKPGMRSVRKGDWKLIQYEAYDGSVRETQLFNLAKNPHEFLPEHQRKEAMETDLAEDPQYADKLAEMQAVLLAEMRRLDDPWRFWNQPSDNLPAPPAPAPKAKGKGKGKAQNKNNSTAK